ncbi:hypothetical protein TOK_3980 [Pseudonocardia sp. N23]|nr:hypothetical protein TOK_3980 [Pseudonocardia sp. N23]
MQEVIELGLQLVDSSVEHRELGVDQRRPIGSGAAVVIAPVPTVRTSAPIDTGGVLVACPVVRVLEVAQR